MGTIPTTPTFVTGEKLTAAKLNQLEASIDFWALTPRCYAYHAATQSLTSGTATLIQLGGELFDIVQFGDAASHDLVTDNSRIYARTTGKYEISGQVGFASNATGARVINIRQNAAGSSVAGTSLYSAAAAAVSGSAAFLPTALIEVPLTAGDYIEMFATQTSGGALSTASGQGGTFLRMKLSGS